MRWSAGNGQECEVVNKKWGRNVKGSAGSGA